jgi:hypothetical protein
VGGFPPRRVASVPISAPVAIVVSLRLPLPTLTMTSIIQTFGWVTTTATAMYSIRTGGIQQHKEWMMRSYPFAMVFIVDRVITFFLVIIRSGELAFVASLWSLLATACFLPSFVIAWQSLVRRPKASRHLTEGNFWSRNRPSQRERWFAFHRPNISKIVPIPWGESKPRDVLGSSGWRWLRVAASSIEVRAEFTSRPVSAAFSTSVRGKPPLSHSFSTATTRSGLPLARFLPHNPDGGFRPPQWRTPAISHTRSSSRRTSYASSATTSS